MIQIDVECRKYINDIMNSEDLSTYHIKCNGDMFKYNWSVDESVFYANVKVGGEVLEYICELIELDLNEITVIDLFKNVRGKWYNCNSKCPATFEIIKGDYIMYLGIGVESFSTLDNFN